MPSAGMARERERAAHDEFAALREQAAAKAGIVDRLARGRRQARQRKGHDPESKSPVYRRGFNRGRAIAGMVGVPSAPHPCPHCRAKDDRDPAHAAGCPRLPRPSQASLLAAALACERGWARRETTLDKGLAIAQA